MKKPVLNPTLTLVLRSQTTFFLLCVGGERSGLATQDYVVTGNQWSGFLRRYLFDMWIEYKNSLATFVKIFQIIWQ